MSTMSNTPIDLTKKSSFFVNKKSGIFDNVYVIGAIFVIILVFIGYAVYNYMSISNNLLILPNSSYYGTDISLYEPVFQDTVKIINDCIDICKHDLTCDGITYNSDTQVCLGTKGGQHRNENANYSAWIKPPSEETENTLKDFKKSILVGYTKTTTVINGQKIHNPYILGYFCYSFNIVIYDFYKNYGSWRHIFHKGTTIESGIILNYQSWENLINDYPEQNIGVWLAPFTNNIRIAITTTSLANTSYGSYQDAFIEKCDSLTGKCYITDIMGATWKNNLYVSDGSNPKTKLTTYIEFIDHDLQNIPINTQFNIAINIRGQDAEIYINGKIVKLFRLDGVPILNKSNLYVMNDKSIGGEISNLIYYPDALSLVNVNDIIKL